MAGQDYDKDLYLMVVGSGNTSRDNWEDNVEDFIFGDRASREATVIVPYTRDMGQGMDVVLNQWAVGADRSNPRYPIVAFVEPEAGHKSISSAKDSTLLDHENGVYATSAALEAAMSYLRDAQADDNEVAVIVLYDENKDVEMLGDIKNYNGIPVYNIDGMVDSFPGFRTTDEILEEERKREDFDAKEAARIASEKELEKLQADADKTDAKPAPRKRAVKKTVAAAPEKPLTTTRKTAAAKKTATSPKTVEQLLAEQPEHKVGDTVVVEGIPFTKHSELPSELEPVKELPQKVDDTPDLWKDVSNAQTQLGTVTHYSVSKESLAELSEGIQEMALSFSKTMGAMTRIIEGK